MLAIVFVGSLMATRKILPLRDTIFPHSKKNSMYRLSVTQEWGGWERVKEEKNVEENKSIGKNVQREKKLNTNKEGKQEGKNSTFSERENYFTPLFRLYRAL